MKDNINIEILKAVKRDNRNEEIKKHGKLISFRLLITKDKTKYTRKCKHKKSENDL